MDAQGGLTHRLRARRVLQRYEHYDPSRCVGGDLRLAGLRRNDERLLQYFDAGGVLRREKFDRTQGASLGKEFGDGSVRWHQPINRCRSVELCKGRNRADA